MIENDDKKHSNNYFGFFMWVVASLIGLAAVVIAARSLYFQQNPSIPLIPTATFMPTVNPGVRWCDNFDGDSFDEEEWYISDGALDNIYLKNGQLNLTIEQLPEFDAILSSVRTGQPIRDISFEANLLSSGTSGFASSGLIVELENGRDFKVQISSTRDDAVLEFWFCKNEASTCSEGGYDEYEHPSDSTFESGEVRDIRIVAEDQRLSFFVDQVLRASTPINSSLSSLRYFLYAERGGEISLTIDDLCVTYS